jgi:diketogulonate reductase-like aldo/keto reductase
MNLIKANSASIPALGFSSKELEEKTAERMVHFALTAGYRHINTAQVYGNEEAVGRAIVSSNVPRDEIFLASKVARDHMAPDQLLASVDLSLSQLQSDYVDLLLLHWPNPGIPLSETMQALQEVHEAGKAHHCGLGNFPTGMLQQALSINERPPLVASQAEYHPFLDISPLLAEVRQAGMAFIAHTPLAQGQIGEDDTLRHIADSHDKSAAQIALRWLVQQEQVGVVVSTSSEEQCQEYLQIFDFSLSDDEMAQIHRLAREDGRLVYPARLAPDWGWPRETEEEEEPGAFRSE